MMIIFQEKELIWNFTIWLLNSCLKTCLKLLKKHPIDQNKIGQNWAGICWQQNGVLKPLHRSVVF